uniref:Uncharacterized protein n=1 Tax=Arundo donax TaxID=35708 RepID=A0A0A8Z9V5_ARUDO
MRGGANTGVCRSWQRTPSP